MRHWFRIGVLVGSGLGLAACSGSLADNLGMGKRSPDEFAVVKRQPLIIPPDYDLRPPDPSAEPPRAARSDVRTRAVLTGVPADQSPAGLAAGGTSGAGEAETRGEDALVARTRAAASDPAARARPTDAAGAPGQVDSGLLEALLTQEAGAGLPGGATIVERQSAPMEGLGR